MEQPLTAGTDKFAGTVGEVGRSVWRLMDVMCRPYYGAEASNEGEGGRRLMSSYARQLQCYTRAATTALPVSPSTQRYYWSDNFVFEAEVGNVIYEAISSGAQKK